ncbi:MAG: MazG-like family protein [Cytophagales bacterium]|nr:MazG-like family protein [Cytophagales bacterium]
MNEFKEITKTLVKFRDERDWAQFHDSKNLAAAISIEAAELNELFLWKTIKESEQVDKKRIKDELADVFAFALLLAHKHGFDVPKILKEKIRKNGERYPVAKAKGNARKYTEL